GAQPPQEVAALVCFLIAPTVVQPSSTAAQIAPLSTLLHEQICADVGSAATPVAAAPGPGSRGDGSNSTGSSDRSLDRSPMNLASWRKCSARTSNQATPVP